MISLVLFIAKGVASDNENFEQVVEDRLYKSYLENTIPEKFVEPFFELTMNQKSIGIEILGVGFHESEWKYFVGKVNNNGSIDLGPLMLNSYNVSNKDFMVRYAKGLDDYKYDTDVYYMTVCIKFFKALRVEYGSFNALKVYNGGPKVMGKNCSADLNKKVTRYANTVYKEINRCFDEWSSFKEENRENIIALIEQEKKQQEELRIAEAEVREFLSQHSFIVSTQIPHDSYEYKHFITAIISRKEDYIEPKRFYKTV